MSLLVGPTSSGWTGQGRGTGQGRASVGDRNPHLAGGARNDLLGRVEVVRVQVGQLRLRDLADLLPGQAADLRLVRRGAALLHAGGLEDELRGGGRLGDEGERPVLVD